MQKSEVRGGSRNGNRSGNSNGNRRPPQKNNSRSSSPAANSRRNAAPRAANSRTGEHSYPPNANMGDMASGNQVYTSKSAKSSSVTTQKQKKQQKQRQRQKRRRRNLSLYYMTVLLLTGIVGIALSLTIFFNIEEIIVIGDSGYTVGDIIDCSKIKIGDNLIRMRLADVEDRILSKMVYVNSVKVKRIFPAKVEIAITPSIPFANISHADGYYLVSKTGRVLENIDQIKPEHIIIKGSDLTPTDIGGEIKSEDEQKDKLIYTILSGIENVEKINIIDITDRFNIKMYYEDRITIELGSVLNLKDKLDYAMLLIDTKIKTKEGTLFVRSNGEASFVEKSDLERYQQDYITATEAIQSTATTTATETSEIVTVG